jgi:hypothetical protein
MISDSDLERIGKAIEAEFPGVKAHFRRESVHQFMRGIGLEIGDRRHGFIVGDDQDEKSFIRELKTWLLAQKGQKHEAKP